MKPNERMKTIKLIRRIIAWGIFVLLIVSFHKPDAFHWVIKYLPKIQFGQSLAGFFSRGSMTAVLTFLTLSVLAVILGRFFCGFLCPLGAFMDFAFFVRSKIKKRPFSFSTGRPHWLIFPSLLLISFWVGYPFPFGQLEPYSLFVSGHAFLLLVMLLAIFAGRAFCAYLCPTGLALRLLAGQSLLGFKLDPATCLNCGACQKACPAFCLNVRDKSLDRGRCLVCLECATVCPNGSLRYGLASPATPNPGRRRFLRLAGAGAMAAGAYLTGENLRARTFAQPDSQPIMPPGALSLAHLNAHCTLCHTCIAVCPNGAIQPSHSGTPILTAKPFLDPYMGFCQYDCVVCGEACPTGALSPLTVEAKRLTRLGLARFDRPECVVIKNSTSCGACAELCPTGAVRMAPGPSGQDEPTLDTDYCIGCGACQKACPVRPVSAIVVTGLSIQQTAKAPRVVISEDLIPTEDFPF
ncbi:MAG: 4Fe-4S binding protein [Deltaproteobacteria bacterium]|jgi:polyferredoxin|nr:4Fe-4S binding protein [Deltaproteobacteria bacterium]